MRNVLRSLPERFYAKITAIEESKDIDKIPSTKLIGNLQTYKLDLTKLGKGSKNKSMALKAKSNETDESSDDEDSKMKSYITRQFKKFMKNANVKGFDKDRKQSNSSQFKSQDIRKKYAKDDGQYIVPSRLNCFKCHGAFTATVDPTEGIVEAVDEEKDSMESKFEKMDKQDDIHTAYAKLYKVSEKYEKLYRLATKKLSDVELNREKLSTKVNEANKTIGALRFENNFLVERTKKLEAELFQVSAQLERISNAKLDEMLSFSENCF